MLSQHLLPFSLLPDFICSSGSLVHVCVLRAGLCAYSSQGMLAQCSSANLNGFGTSWRGVNLCTCFAQSLPDSVSAPLLLPGLMLARSCMYNKLCMYNMLCIPQQLKSCSQRRILWRFSHAKKRRVIRLFCISTAAPHRLSAWLSLSGMIASQTMDCFRLSATGSLPHT